MKWIKTKNRWLGLALILCLLLLWQNDGIWAYFTASDSAVRYFLNDTQPPTLTVITPAGMTPEDPTYAVTSIYTVTGTVSDDHEIRQVTVNGVEAVLQRGGAWSLDIVLEDHITQTIEVVAVDMAGNTKSEVRYVRYDSSIRFEDFTITRYNRGMIGYTSDTTDLVIPETFYDPDSNTWYHVVAIGFKAGTNTSATYAAFSNNSQLVSVTIPGSVKSIGRYAFYTDVNLKKLTLGYGIEYLDMSAFSQCSGLTEVVMPDSITTIDASIFGYDSGLTRAILSEGLTQVSSGMFAMCTSLTGQIVLPDTVTVIGNNAFMSTKITSIVIPAGVISVGENAFRSCNQLTHVYFKGTREQWEQIRIGKNNNPLTGAQIVCQYGSE